MSSVAQPQGNSPAAGAPSRAQTADRGHHSLLATGREAAFIDLSFETDDRPRLVTGLLALTAAPPGESETLTRDDSPLWSLSVATRLKRLLHTVRDTEGIAALSLRLRCPHTDCRQFLEIELAFADLDTLHDEAADQELLRFPQGRADGPSSAEDDAEHRPYLAFRRPTGDDLRRWRATDSAPADPQAIFRSLLIPNTAESSELPPADTCAAAFSEFDALVAFQLTTTCPHCGRESTHPVDLETLALNRLHALQQQLYRENHRLAHAYGWSENDILGVPRARRLRYLAQLEASS